MNQTITGEIRLGIDVGGTNTDAVLMTGNEVIGSIKRATTEDVASGITNAVSALLDKTKINAADISHVMVGTTQFINAFLQRKNLTEVAAIRVSLPKTDGIPPMVAWPEDLIPILGSNIYMVKGGAYYTAEEYIALDEAELEKVAKDIAQKGISSVAISSNFAPIRPDIEERAAEIIRKAVPEANITLSAQVGGIGLIDRENAAIVNASLAQFAGQVVGSMLEAFERLQISCPILFSQNDGTLITKDVAMQFPIYTCAAGPTNSIRGAAFLTGLDKAVVVDIGGTTTDIGFLIQGFPRETTTENYIGGVRTNFRMPDVLSIALGGGSVVTGTDQGVTIGPESVGYQLTEKALIFGGNTLTTTDIAVRGGYAELGNPEKVAHISEEFTAEVSGKIHTFVEDAVDQMRTSSEAIPVVLVGGGSLLISSSINGASELHQPENAGVANAVGAAIAQVSGRTDKLYDVATMGREAALAQAKQDASDLAVAAGAAPDTVNIIGIQELPMTHMQTGSVQIIVRAVGDLAGTV